MATKPNEWKYAQVVNEQNNPNLGEHTHWANMVNAVGSDTRTWASGYYDKKGGNTIIPQTLTAHDFNLDIPVNAYVKSVTVELCLKSSMTNLKVYAPSVHFMIYGGRKNVSGNANNERRVTGWDSYGDYAVYSNEVLSTSEKIIRYTIPESELAKRSYPATAFNQNMMGVDIDFEQPLVFNGTHIAIYLNWVRIRVDYEMPETYFRWALYVSDEYNPYTLQLDHTYNIPLLFGNKSKSSAGHIHNIEIQLPFGVHLESYEIKDPYSRLEVIDAYYGKYRWVADGGTNAENRIDLKVHTDMTGFQTLTATNTNEADGRTVKGYIYVRGSEREYSSADISSGIIKKATPSCFHFKTKVYSNDNSITYNVVVDGENQADSSCVSQFFKDFYNNHNGTGNYLIDWTLHQDSANQGVSIDWANTDNNNIKFNIPKKTNVEIVWTGCFIPITTGENTLYLVDGDSGESYTYEYDAISEGVKGTFTMGNTIWYDHRILTETTVEGYLVPFASKDTDRYMYEEDCNFTMHIQEPIAYVGCVPLVHSHHDPQSDFSNKSIKNTYRNKIYTGKTGEIEEKISFELHLPPRDWTTLQGLCEMDKPVPVNAVPTAFEGDILNHRGWVELGGVKNVKKTNPLYYHGELDVEYITHNINTRFQISKGVGVSNYTSDTLKELLDYVVESGDEFADYTYTNTDGEIVHNRTGYFIVDTDGNYIYDVEQANNRRTLMTMDNAQSIHINSVDALSEATKISMEWYSTKILEDRENNIERIIRLRNGDGTVLMEYKYFDYDFDTSSDNYSCRVNCSVLNRSVGSFDTIIDADMKLGSDVECLNLTKDTNGNIVQETEPVDIDAMPETSRTYYDASTDETITLSADPFTYNDFMYGSKIHFTLQGNVLSIVDEGFTGREIHQSGIQLEKGEYYYEVEFINHNSDGDTNDVLHFFDFTVQESILSSDYKQLYSDIIVSSFPIPNKTLVYFRNSEEGTLYYYKNDGSAFTYIQEPFYMYFCGVDLKSREGISLFNLNNSYTTFYLQNGLVRIGFNRFNGQVYLFKYDLYSQSYVPITTLQLKEYTDFTLGAFSDDKIEIKVGKTVFSMYRGYPYVVVKHGSDDIDFITTFNRAYAEGVNGVNNEFPVLWRLVNSDNLLPSCITGEDISSSCIDVDTVYNDDVGTEPTLTLSKTSPATVYNGDTVIFNVSGTVSNIDEEIPIGEAYIGAFGEYSTEIVTDGEYPLKIDLHSSLGSMIQTGDNAELRASLVDYEFKGISGVQINFYEIYEPYSLILQADKNIIQTGQNAEISAIFKDEDGSRVRGQRVDFYEVYTPTNPIVKATPPVLQTGEYSQISATYKDVDGSAIRDEHIDFVTVMDSTDWTMSINSTDDIIQTTDNAEITATVKDANNNAVSGVYVRFYEEID